jgi:ParB family transcriptional regulator, chromosome partitioning protein
MIAPNPNQPRRSFPEAELDELASSIREHGILQPLILSPKESGYELISGERRLRAAEKAGLTLVPAIVVNPRDSVDSLTIALVENIQRADLGAIELARAYRRLIEEFGRTQEEIALAVGKSRPHIANTIRLLELSDPVQKAIDDGLITAGHARALLMAPIEVRALLFEQMVRRSISVRQAEKAARAASKPGNNKTAAGEKIAVEDSDVEFMVKEMERSLESSLKRKCAIYRKKRGAGTITLEFYNDKDLESLVEKLRGN